MEKKVWLTKKTKQEKNLVGKENTKKMKLDEIDLSNLDEVEEVITPVVIGACACCA